MTGRTCVRGVLILVSLGLFACSGMPLCGAEIKFIPSDHGSGETVATVVPSGPLLHTTQIFGLGESGRVASPELSGQLTRIWSQLRDLLTANQSALSQVVKLNIYVVREADVVTVSESIRKTFSTDSLPAVSYVVTRLPIQECLIAVDAIALTKSQSAIASTMRPATSPQPAHLAGDLRVSLLPEGSRIYVSGQAEKSVTLAESTRLTLESLDKSLKFCGRTRADIVQVKSFLKPMSSAADVDRELVRFFAPYPVPAASYVEWESGLPIEIEVVAAGGPVGQDRASIEFLTPPAMTASPVFSRIVRVSHPKSIYIAGLYGPADADGTQQVTDIFSQLTKALELTGSDLQHLAKATYYVSQDDPGNRLNELRPKYYRPQSPPAASKAQVHAVGRPGTGLTLDMIAVPAD